MRKFIFLFIFVLMCVLPVSALAAEYPGYLRVGLFFGTTAKDSVTLASDGGFTVGLGESTGFEAAFELAENEIIIRPSENGNFMIGENEVECGSEMSFKTPSGTVRVGGVPYRGFIYLKANGSGKMSVINVVDMEGYLYSVVGQEMSPSWNIEALKAQAVCARTYALTHLNTYKNYGIDLCTTQNTQVYLGIDKETESTIAAVDGTRGQTVKYGGKTVDVYYFSSGGGSTENSENVWTSALPYLRGITDPYENPAEASYYNWTKVYTRDEIKNKMGALGYKLGDILAVNIDSRAESGRVTKLTVVGTEGSKTFEKGNIRAALSLNSQQFDILGDTKGAAVLGGERLEGNAVVLTAEGTKKVNASIYNVLGAEGIQFYDTTSISGDTFTFEGRGWGHAVCMCQWGAKAMADMGFSYIDILKFYFTGIEVS